MVYLFVTEVFTQFSLPRCCCFLEFPKKLRMKRTIARRFNSLTFRKPFVCHREGYFPEGHGDGYFKCSRNPDGTFSRIRLRCLGGRSFDNTLKRCIYVRGRRELSKCYRFRNHKPYLYFYNRRKRGKYLRPFRNRRNCFSFKKWKHYDEPRKKNILRNAHRRVKSKKIKDNTVTTQSFIIPSQTNLKSSTKLNHGKHVNKGFPDYKPSPNFDENLEATYEAVHKNYDANIRAINRERREDVDSLPSLSTEDSNTESPTLKQYVKNGKYPNEATSLFVYVKKKRECPDKPCSPISSKNGDTSTKEDQNVHSDGTTVENFVISSPNRDISNSKSNDNNSDEGNEPEKSIDEHFRERKDDVNFKSSYGNKNKGRDSNYPSEENLVIEIPFDGATQACDGDNLVINKQNDVQPTLSPNIVIKLRQSQQMSTDSSATEMTLEKIVQHRMRLSNDQQRSASKNPNKFLILVRKNKSRLDSRELINTSGKTITTTSTTSATPLTTPTFPHTQTTTKTIALMTTTSRLIRRSTTKTTTSTCSCRRVTARTTTGRSHRACPLENKHTTDSCSSSTKVGSLYQIFKHLKDDYISKIHDHSFITTSPGHRHKGHRIGNGHVNPTSFYICSGEKSNNSRNCNSFYLCHSARSAGETLKLKVPCPSGMGFDFDLNKCTTNMGKVCKSIPRE